MSTNSFAPLMNLKTLRTIKADERGVMYDCGKLKYIFRKKGTISANHVHEDPEVLYLVNGEIELTVDEETQNVSAPIRIDIPPETYHRLIALSDIALLEDRSGEK